MYKMKFNDAEMAVLAYCHIQEGCITCPVRQKICHKPQGECIKFLTEMVELKDPLVMNILGIEEITAIPLVPSEIHLMQTLGTYKVEKKDETLCSLYNKNNVCVGMLSSMYFPSLIDIGDIGLATN